MTNFFEQIEFIKGLLTQAGYKNLTNDILEMQLTGGTRGEVLILVCGRLLGIKDRYSDVYSIIALEADELIAYCRSIGMYPKATYSGDVPYSE